MAKVDLDAKYYTPREIAEIFSITHQAVNKWLHSGELRGIKLGRAWRVKEDDLFSFIEHSTKFKGRGGDNEE